MANSRKIVDRLSRITRTDTKAAPSAEAPPAPREGEPEGGRPRHILEPDELTNLRKIVRTEQLQPFRPDRPTPPDHSLVPQQPAPPPEPAAAAEPETAPPVEILPPDPDPHSIPEAVRKDNTVSNIDVILKEAMQIDGAIGIALVDYTSGMTLGQAGGGMLNLDVAAAGNTEVVRAKLRTMEALGLQDGIEDILITLSSQYHLIRLIQGKSGAGLFLYLALDKGKSNLALARHKLANLENQIDI